MDIHAMELHIGEAVSWEGTHSVEVSITERLHATGLAIREVMHAGKPPKCRYKIGAGDESCPM